MNIDELTLGDIKKLSALYNVGAVAESPKVIKDGGIKIVVLQRGWVVIGRYSQIGSDCKLTDGAVIRIWGTTKGLPELVEGPTGKTVIDKTAKPICFHELTVVLTLDAEEKAWSKVL